MGASFSSTYGVNPRGGGGVVSTYGENPRGGGGAMLSWVAAILKSSFYFLLLSC